MFALNDLVSGLTTQQSELGKLELGKLELNEIELGKIELGK
jgi:hypothetical protein